MSCVTEMALVNASTAGATVSPPPRPSHGTSFTRKIKTVVSTKAMVKKMRRRRASTPQGHKDRSRDERSPAPESGGQQGSSRGQSLSRGISLRVKTVRALRRASSPSDRRGRASSTYQMETITPQHGAITPRSQGSSTEGSRPDSPTPEEALRNEILRSLSLSPQNTVPKGA